MTKSHTQKKFYGTTTVGEKGQVVIPSEARIMLKLKKGEKLLVFGMGGDMVTLAKLSEVEQFASHLAKKVKAIDEIIKKIKD